VNYEEVTMKLDPVITTACQSIAKIDQRTFSKAPQLSLFETTDTNKNELLSESEYRSQIYGQINSDGNDHVTSKEVILWFGKNRDMLCAG
jgi:hypothetical protein